MYQIFIKLHLCKDVCYELIHAKFIKISANSLSHFSQYLQLVETKCLEKFLSLLRQGFNLHFSHEMCVLHMVWVIACCSVFLP
jgi:hypothetical protein